MSEARSKGFKAVYRTAFHNQRTKARVGAIAFAVLDELIEEARHENDYHITIGHAELAERVGISPRAAHYALTKLELAGLVRTVERGRIGRNATRELTRPTEWTIERCPADPKSAHRVTPSDSLLKSVEGRKEGARGALSSPLESARGAPSTGKEGAPNDKVECTKRHEEGARGALLPRNKNPYTRKAPSALARAGQQSLIETSRTKAELTADGGQALKGGAQAVVARYVELWREAYGADLRISATEAGQLRNALKAAGSVDAALAALETFFSDSFHAGSKHAPGAFVGQIRRYITTPKAPTPPDVIGEWGREQAALAARRKTVPRYAESFGELPGLPTTGGKEPR